MSVLCFLSYRCYWRCPSVVQTGVESDHQRAFSRGSVHRAQALRWPEYDRQHVRQSRWQWASLKSVSVSFKQPLFLKTAVFFIKKICFFYLSALIYWPSTVYVCLPQEISRLAGQLRRLYGSNKKAPRPFHVFLTDLQEDSRLYRECLRMNEGFLNYMVIYCYYWCLHPEFTGEYFLKERWSRATLFFSFLKSFEVKLQTSFFKSFISA